MGWCILRLKLHFTYEDVHKAVFGSACIWWLVQRKPHLQLYRVPFAYYLQGCSKPSQVCGTSQNLISVAQNLLNIWGHRRDEFAAINLWMVRRRHKCCVADFAVKNSIKHTHKNVIRSATKSDILVNKQLYMHYADNPFCR